MIHDLKMPVQMMMGCAQMIRLVLEQREPEAEKYLNMLVGNGLRMQRMLQNLLDGEKIGSGNAALNAATGDAVKLLKEICDLTEPYAVQRGIEIKFESDESVFFMDYDDEKLTRMILNLISNALKFTPEDGTVCINLARENKCALISVTDSGIGIPPDMTQMLFRKYVSAGGCGLGLYIVREFAHLHKGDAWVSTNLTGGTTFHIRLPIHQPTAVGHMPPVRTRAESVKIELSDFAC